MIEIKEKQDLQINNLICFRGKIKQSELESVGNDMEIYIRNAGAKRVGYPITTTFAVEGDTMDVEMLIPIDKCIASNGKFVFKDQIKIVNAMLACYKGNPSGLQDVFSQLNQYITEHKLQSITTGYNITRKFDVLNPEIAEIDVYVGISPNIL